MTSIKIDSNKIVNIFLSTTLLSVFSLSAFNFFIKSNNNSMYSQSGTVQVNKVDENNAILHCNTNKESNNDFLFSKTKICDGYKYDISDVNNTKKYYGFNSPLDISFDDGLSNNPQINAAVWGIAAGGGGAAVLGAASTIGGAALAAAPVASAVAGAGATTAAAGIGWAAGASVAAAVAVTAAPVAIIGGAAVGLAGIG